MIMKRMLTLIISALLFVSLIPLSGCQKAEEPKKPEVSAVSPALPTTPQTAIPPPAPEQPVTPSAKVTPAAPPAPATCEPPAVSAKPLDTDIVRVAGFNSPEMQNPISVLKQHRSFIAFT